MHGHLFTREVSAYVLLGGMFGAVVILGIRRWRARSKWRHPEEAAHVPRRSRIKAAWYALLGRSVILNTSFGIHAGSLHFGSGPYNRSDRGFYSNVSFASGLGDVVYGENAEPIREATGVTWTLNFLDRPGEDEDDEWLP